MISLVLALLMLASVFSFAEDGPMLAGGWQVGESANQQVMEGFDKAMENFLGASFEPDLLIATQVVAGTNYCFLCKQTPVTALSMPKGANGSVHKANMAQHMSSVCWWKHSTMMRLPCRLAER